LTIDDTSKTLVSSGQFADELSTSDFFFKIDFLRASGSIAIRSLEELLVRDSSLFALLGFGLRLIVEVGLIEEGSVMLRSLRICHDGSELRGLGRELAACLAFFLEAELFLGLRDKFFSLELWRNFFSVGALGLGSSPFAPSFCLSKSNILTPYVKLKYQAGKTANE
jgi:hypothetical protein